MTTIEITITEDAPVELPAVEPVAAWPKAYSDMLMKYFNINHLNLSDEVLKEMSRLTGEKLRAVKQRDALVKERDAILVERDKAYEAEDSAQRTLIEACAERGAFERRATDAEASLLKASAEVGRLQRLLDDECKFNGKLDREIVSLHSDLEQSEAKRLGLLAALDEKDVLINDFSNENLRLDDALDAARAESGRLAARLNEANQQLTELKLKHNQPAAFPWVGPGQFGQWWIPAGITATKFVTADSVKRAEAAAATSKTEVKS